MVFWANWGRHIEDTNNWKIVSSENVHFSDSRVVQFLPFGPSNFTYENPMGRKKTFRVIDGHFDNFKPKWPKILYFKNEHLSDSKTK